MKFLKTLAILLEKVRITRRLKTLDVASSGIEDGIPYIDLNGGFRFYGLSPIPKDHKYYKLFAGKAKAQIPFECYKVALDIYIRFIEGGLKLGGPRKELYYQVKGGDKIAEMGAYMGFYTLYLATKVGPKGKIIAIEPMPDNLEYLKRNIEYNKLSNVRIIEKGVWNRNELQTFYQAEGDTQSASMVIKGENKRKVEIEVDTLDNILEDAGIQELNFMIIQLNGIEHEALEGLTKIDPENIAIAARYKKGGLEPVPRIKELLQKRNYTIKVEDKDYVYAKKQDLDMKV